MDQDASIVRRALREPLLQFAIPAALLFILDVSVSGGGEGEIRVTPQIVSTLVTERETVLGRPLGEAERACVIEEFVDQEVLLREAIARGLDRHDGKVREHLAAKMAFLMSEEPPEPTHEQLLQFHREHADAYSTRPSLDLEHAYFERTPEDVPGLLAALRGGAAPGTLGDPFFLGARLRFVTPEELASALGVEFAERVDALEVGAWCGPIRSARGAHLVRVTARHAERVLGVEELGGRLREDWRSTWCADLQRERLQDMRARYRVVVATEASAP